MSDKLLDLYDKMVRDAVVHNVYSNTNEYSTVLVKAPAYKDKLVQAAESLTPFGTNEFNSQNPYRTPQSKADDPLVKQTKELPVDNSNRFNELAQYGDSFAKNPASSDPLVRLKRAMDPTGDEIQKYTDTKNYSRDYDSKTLNYGSGKLPDTVVWANGTSTGTPSEGDIRSTNHFGGNRYGETNQFAPIAGAVPHALGVTDIFAIANWARNIAREFGVEPIPGQQQAQYLQSVSKGVTFLASQFLLASMNPTDPQYGGPLNAIYNPAHLPLSAIPFLRVTTTLGSPILSAVQSVDGNVYSNNLAKLPPEADRHRLMREGGYKKSPSLSDVADLSILASGPGFIGDIAKKGKPDVLGGKVIPGVTGVPITAQVDKDGPFAGAAVAGPFHTNLYTEKRPYSTDPAIDLEYIESMMLKDPSLTAEQIQLQALFKGSSALGSLGTFIPGVKPKNNKYEFLRNINPRLTTKGIETSSPNDVSVNFGNEGDDGTITNIAIPTDDANYMPFSFEDIRQRYKTTLMFRAFLRSIDEGFQPNWRVENYYGRVDPVATYSSTNREISLAFEVVAWSPEDLPAMWKKLHKLQSMVYPTYTTDYYTESGPIVRLRVGDLICGASSYDTSKRGLPGFINNLAFNYDMQDVWNVKKDYKTPRRVTVSLGFTVIHEGNPAVYKDNANGKFGCLEYRNNQPTVSESDIRGIVGTIKNEEPLSVVY